MNIILFGGNSQRNKDWIHGVGATIANDFDTCLVHNYDHWEGRGEFIDLSAELAKLRIEAQDLGEYAVFAKSVGSLLTLMAISQGILKPTRCMFVGLPVKLAKEENIPLPGLLNRNYVPTLIMQNSDDPLITYGGLVDYLKQTEATNYTTIQLPGDTHSYDDLEKIRAEINAFMPVR